MKKLAALLFAAAPLLAQGTVPWEHDLAAAQQRARTEHKVIFVDVWTEWCGWCTRLQKNVFPKPEVQAALAKVVPLSLKTQLKDGSPTDQKAMEKRFNVRGFPALFIVDAEGKVLRSNPGYLEPAELVKFLESK